MTIRKIGVSKFRVTERDLKIFRWVVEQYAVRSDQLEVLMWRKGQGAGGESKLLSPNLHSTERISAEVVRQRVKKWEDMGLVERRRYIVGQPAWIWLKRDGLALIGGEYPYLEPHLSTLEHTYWVNQVRLSMERNPEKSGLVAWKSEREIKQEQARDERTKRKRVPDAEIQISKGVIALEVELSRKVIKRLKVAMTELVKDYKTIWYFTNEQTEEYVKRHLKSLNEEQRSKFKVYSLKATVS